MLRTAGRLWGNACGRLDEGGTIIGAIGVSGALSSQDAQVASATMTDVPARLDAPPGTTPLVLRPCSC
jgi:hypothetical protein